MICFVLEMTIKICVLNLNQSAYSPMENNVSTHAVLTASTRHVTELTVVVCMAVKRENNVKVYLTNVDVFRDLFIFDKVQNFI